MSKRHRSIPYEITSEQNPPEKKNKLDIVKHENSSAPPIVNLSLTKLSSPLAASPPSPPPSMPMLHALDTETTKSSYSRKTDFHAIDPNIIHSAKPWLRPRLTTAPNPKEESICFMLVDVSYEVCQLSSIERDFVRKKIKSTTLSNGGGITPTSESVIQIFGVTENGHSIMVHAHAFQPYFWVEIPDNIRGLGPDAVEEYIPLFLRTLDLSIHQSIRAANRIEHPHVSSDETDINLSTNENTEDDEHNGSVMIHAMPRKTGVRSPPSEYSSDESKNESNCDDNKPKNKLPGKFKVSDLLYITNYSLSDSKRSIYGFTNAYKLDAKFLQIYVKEPQYVSKARYLLETVSPIEIIFRWKDNVIYNSMDGLTTFESNIPYTLRAMVDFDISGGSWLELPKCSYMVRERSKNQPFNKSSWNSQSVCQIEIDCDIHDLIPRHDINKIAALRILSFDIECLGRKGHFPDAQQDPVIVICATLETYGTLRDQQTKANTLHDQQTKADTNKGDSKHTSIDNEKIGDEKHSSEREENDAVTRFRRQPWVIAARQGYHVDTRRYHRAFIANTCANVPGVHVTTYKGESELLLAFQRFFQECDPDIVTGYNWRTFDLPYVVNRMIKLKLSKNIKFSRIANRIGKLKTSVFKSSARGYKERHILPMAGRIQMDMLEEIKGGMKKYRSNTLGFISGSILQRTKEDVHHSLIADLYAGTALDRARLVSYCDVDALLPCMLMDKLQSIVSQVEMARVSGVTIEMLIDRGQQIKVMSGLLRKCKRSNLLIPSMSSGGDDSAVQGAIVISPTPQFIRDHPVEMLDFASMYPSVMQAYNLCYSTFISPTDKIEDIKNILINRFPDQLKKIVERVKVEQKGISSHSVKHEADDSGDSKRVKLEGEESKHDVPLSSDVRTSLTDPQFTTDQLRDRFNENKTLLSSYFFPRDFDPSGIFSDFPHSVSPTDTPPRHRFICQDIIMGIIPEVLQGFLSQRKAVKNLMNAESDPEKKLILDKRQNALKISGNSIYGFTKANMLPMEEITETVTAHCRALIVGTTKFIEYKYRRIHGYAHDAQTKYGDTDSNMIKFGPVDLKESYALGDDAAACVSALVTKPISIEHECQYFPVLLLKKKRYAGVKRIKGKNAELMIKGAESVRRDGCLLQSKVQEDCLTSLLMNRDIRGAVELVHKVISDLKTGQVDMGLLTVSKTLSKPVDQYTTSKPAHVKVALKRMRRDPNDVPAANDRVSYIQVQQEYKTKSDVKSTDGAEDPIFALQEGLSLDIDYYIERQLKPSLKRIFMPVFDNVESVVDKELFQGPHMNRVVRSTVPVKRAGTLMAFYGAATRVCVNVACKSPITQHGSKNLCVKCVPKKEAILNAARKKYRDACDNHTKAWNICVECRKSGGAMLDSDKSSSVSITGSYRDHPKIGLISDKCANYDCKNFYARHGATRKCQALLADLELF